MRKQAFMLLALTCVCAAGTASAQDTVNCGKASEGVITSGQFYAAGEVSDALNHISAMRNGGDSARCVHWFGSTTPAIIDRVENTLEGVYSGLSEMCCQRLNSPAGCPGPDPIPDTPEK